jgi:hypothetical protein
VPGDKQSGPPPEGPPWSSATSTTGTIPDPSGIRRRARSRIRAMEEHRRVCRQLEGLASLATYYGPRRPRSAPLAQFLAEVWWAA